MRKILNEIDPNVEDYRRVISKPTDINHPVLCWHTQYSYFQKHHPDYERIKDYTFFTFIRNPIDRLISEYNMILSEPHHVYYPWVSKISIYDFIQRMCPRGKSQQSSYLLDSNGVISPNIKILSYEKLKDSDFLENFFISLGVQDNNNLKSICSRPPVHVGKSSLRKDQLDYARLKECVSFEALLFYMYHA
jgi:hypothetical protein